MRMNISSDNLSQIIDMILITHLLVTIPNTRCNCTNVNWQLHAPK